MLNKIIRDCLVHLLNWCYVKLQTGEQKKYIRKLDRKKEADCINFLAICGTKLVLVQFDALPANTNLNETDHKK